MRVFIITDTHWFHSNMCQYEGRPEDFTERIIDNWRKLVDLHDLVIHLGDVILHKASELESIMASLPGTKILTLGNHDKHSSDWYMKRGFAFACEFFVYKHIVFSHEPLRILSGEMNIFGHYHRNYDHLWEWLDMHIEERNHKNYRLVQIEDTLSPILLEDLLRAHK